MSKSYIGIIGKRKSSDPKLNGVPSGFINGNYVGFADQTVARDEQNPSQIPIHTKEDLLKWYDKDYCLQRVKKDYFNIRYCKIITNEMLLYIINTYKGPYSINNLYLYLPTLTEEQQLILIKHDSDLIGYIKNPTKLVLEKVIRDKPINIGKLNNPSEELCMLAITISPTGLVIQCIDIKKYPRVYDKYVLLNR